MTLYLVQPRDQIFVKGYGALSFAKNVVKNIGENLLIMLKDLLQMHLKLLQKEQYKKQQKHLMI